MKTTFCKSISVVLAALIVLAGCGGSPVVPKALNSPLATPVAAATLASILPSPNAQAATVVGRLINPRDQQPVAGMVAFVEKTTPEHTVPDIVYAPPNDQPHAMTNRDGEFTISNVPAGEYVLIIFLPPTTIQVVTELNGETPRLINVKDGDVFNVGTIAMAQ